LLLIYAGQTNIVPVNLRTIVIPTTLFWLEVWLGCLLKHLIHSHTHTMYNILAKHSLVATY